MDFRTEASEDNGNFLTQEGGSIGLEYKVIGRVSARTII